MLYNKYLEGNVSDKTKSIISTLKKLFSFKNLTFMLFAFLLSTKVLVGEFRPFNYVLLAVASAFDVPLILVLLSSVIGLAIGGYSTTLITLIIFFLLYNLITALVNIEGINKKYSICIKFMVSITILQIVSSFITGELFTSLFTVLSTIVVSGIIYLVCVTGMNVIINLKNGFVYTKEESVMMVTTLAMLTSIFSNVSFKGFNVVEILAFIIILIYGWSSGALLGGLSGLVVGLTYMCLCGVSIPFVIALTFTGFISGLLRRFGKIPVVIAFAIGNVALSFIASGTSQMSVIVCEVLIASVVLFFMPKRFEVRLDNLFDLRRGIEAVKNNLLASATVEKPKEKIGAVSEVFESLSDITLIPTEEDIAETAEVIRKYLLSYANNTCFACNDIDECIEKENLEETSNFLAQKLENGESIEPEMLKFRCKESDIIISNLYDIYNSMKLMRVLKQRELDEDENGVHRYKEASKFLDEIEEDIKEGEVVKDETQRKLRDEFRLHGFNIYEDEFDKEKESVEYTFVTDILTDIDRQKRQIIELANNVTGQSMMIKLLLNISKTEKSKVKIVSIPKYSIKSEVVSEIKYGETISGDAYLKMELQDLKDLLALSDGVGIGEASNRSAKETINLVQRTLNGEFNNEKATELVNSVIKLKGEDENFASLDVAVINQKDAMVYFIKLGASPTYIIENGKVITINSTTVPLDALENLEYAPIKRQLQEGDFIIQVTDGMIQENSSYQVNYLKNYLSTCDTTKTAKTIASEIREVLYLNNGNELEDDATVIVTKIEKNI